MTKMRCGSIPAIKGIYCLIIRVRTDITPVIGALGATRCAAGTYIYVGSAQNNLEKRVARHLSHMKKLRWHIDYLLDHPETGIVKVFYKNAGADQECNTARMLSKAGQPVKGFGVSDCGCFSHLIRVDTANKLINLGFTALYP